MKLRFADLWTWKGTVDRGPYVLLGLGLFFIKYSLDRLLVRALTGKEWLPLHYWSPGDFFGLATRTPYGTEVSVPLLLTALPFIWTGVVLTLRRIRSVGFARGAVLIFFVPVFNVFLFLLLSLLPPHPATGPRDDRYRRWLAGAVPRGKFGSAVAAVLVTAVPVLALVVLGTKVLGNYGWGLFVGIPFLLGFLSALVYGYHEPRRFAGCLGVCMISLGLTAAVLLVLAIEGVVCVFMASPIAAVIAAFGTFAGYLVQARERGGVTALALLAGLPILLGAEAAVEPEPPLLEVRSTIDIDAPPPAVWRHVVAFAELPPPDELLFRTGLAYPIRAEIRGRGAGAVRHCVFSTGPFVEPIEVWDEPRLLAFSVSAQPAPLHEWTPYPGVPPPHLDGYFLSRRGQFLLAPLPGGRTRLEGTTWYTHRMWPTFYWSLWSDAVIHRIHLRVLRHVKRRAEGGP